MNTGQLTGPGLGAVPPRRMKQGSGLGVGVGDGSGSRNWQLAAGSRELHQ